MSACPTLPVMICLARIVSQGLVQSAGGARPAGFSPTPCTVGAHPERKVQ